MYDLAFAMRGPEYREAEDRRYSLECRERMLEANLARASLEDFDWIMAELNRVHAAQPAAIQECFRLHCKYAAEQHALNFAEVHD